MPGQILPPPTVSLNPADEEGTWVSCLHKHCLTTCMLTSSMGYLDVRSQQEATACYILISFFKSGGWVGVRNCFISSFYLLLCLSMSCFAVGPAQLISPRGMEEEGGLWAKFRVASPGDLLGLFHPSLNVPNLCYLIVLALLNRSLKIQWWFSGCGSAVLLWTKEISVDKRISCV